MTRSYSGPDGPWHWTSPWWPAWRRCPSRRGARRHLGCRPTADWAVAVRRTERARSDVEATRYVRRKPGVHGPESHPPTRLVRLRAHAVRQVSRQVAPRVLSYRSSLCGDRSARVGSRPSRLPSSATCASRSSAVAMASVAAWWAAYLGSPKRRLAASRRSAPGGGSPCPGRAAGVAGSSCPRRAAGPGRPARRRRRCRGSRSRLARSGRPGPCPAEPRAASGTTSASPGAAARSSSVIPCRTADSPTAAPAGGRTAIPRTPSSTTSPCVTGTQPSSNTWSRRGSSPVVSTSTTRKSTWENGIAGIGDRVRRHHA